MLLTLATSSALAWVVVRPALADRETRAASTVRDFERALRWAPRDASTRLRSAQARLARLDAGDLDGARLDLAVALLRRPAHGSTWLELAALLDHQGDPLARQALDTALRMDRHQVRLRWEAAALLLRWDERAAALEHLKYLIAVDRAERDSAFRIARRLLGPAEAVTALLPERSEALDGILASAIARRDVELADAAWARRPPAAPPVVERLARGYVELLLSERRGERAERVWSALMARPGRDGSGNSIYNGNFELGRMLGWGLDWRIDRTWGVDVALDPFVAAEGRQSLRFSFNAFPSLDFSGVSQLVPVKAGHEYRLRALARAAGFNTRQGVKLQVVTPDGELIGETPAVAGTTDEWVPLETRMRVPAGASLVRLLVRREKASAPEGNLGGKVWLDEVRFTAPD